MGQYFSAVLLKPNWEHTSIPVSVALCPSTFGESMKLMGFSYIGSSFIKAVELLLSTNFKGFHFAIVGDYADNKRTAAYPGAVVKITSSFEKNEQNAQKLTSALGIKGYKTLLAQNELESKSITEKAFNDICSIDGVIGEYQLNMYKQAKENMNALPDRYLELANSLNEIAQTNHNVFRYAINHTKNEYIVIPKEGKELKIHPLALLCADGNENGGGGTYPDDFKDIEYVGRWAYDDIFVTAIKPDECKEIKPKFQTY